jgi:hypothetical protein
MPPSFEQRFERTIAFFEKGLKFANSEIFPHVEVLLDTKEFARGCDGNCAQLSAYEPKCSQLLLDGNRQDELLRSALNCYAGGEKTLKFSPVDSSIRNARVSRRIESGDGFS